MAELLLALAFGAIMIYGFKLMSRLDNYLDTVMIGDEDNDES